MLGLMAPIAVGSGPAEAADEYYPRPWSGAYVFDGHGFGHGIGMSQWGAYGAALAGRTWAQIVDFYYPGTTRTSIGNPKIRVDLRGDLGDSDEVRFFPGGTIGYSKGAEGAAGGTLPSRGSNGSTILEWRVTGPSKVFSTDSTSLDLSYRTGSSWVHFTQTGYDRYNFTSSAGVINARTTAGTQAPIRGQLRAIRLPQYSRTQPVAYLSMDTYLNGVVPYEAFSTWPLHAQAAQAVAARTYAAYALDHPRLAGVYDICDTISCQVFKGRAWIPAATAAIDATDYTALLYAGAPALAMFSASNGGRSVAGSAPYLVAQVDPYDDVAGNVSHTWSTTVSVSRIESAWPAIGSLRGLRITSRSGGGDWGGYVNTMIIEGSSGSVTVSGDQVRGALSLKSRWFRPRPSATATSYPRDLTGDGRADLVVKTTTGLLKRYSLDSSGRPGSVTIVGSGYAPSTKVFTAGAWDADARSDVMVLSRGSLYLRRSTGAGLAASELIASGWTFDSVFGVGDFSGDGMSDLLGRRNDGTLRRHSSDGSGGFGAAPATVATGFDDFDLVAGAGDLTGNGRPDVIAREPGGRMWLYGGNGLDALPARVDLGTTWSSYTDIVGLGRVDGDEHDDLIALDTSGRLWLLAGDGAAGLQPRTLLISGWTNVDQIAP